MASRLSRQVFSRYWEVHATFGVITSLVLYVMFFLGAVVLFFRPLSVWEEPLLQQPAPDLTPLTSVDVPLALAAPLPEEFYYYLPEDGLGLPKIGYYLPGTTLWRMWWLDPLRHAVIPKREMAASYAYDLHYLWHDVTGYWLQYGGGILVFGFLLALVTGVLIHLHNLRRQLQQFRPFQQMRVLFSDLHKVLGVFGLPFQLVYALTGTLMVLSPLLFSLAVGPVFGGDLTQAARTAGALVEDAPALSYGVRQDALPLSTLIARARQAEPRLEPEMFHFAGFGRAEGTVDVIGQVRGQTFGDGRVRMRATDGEVLLIETPDREPAVAVVARWIHGLHTVHYGGLTARLLLFFLALCACITILTGNWIYIERRRSHAPGITSLLARLTVGVGAGAIVAVVALLLASRLLPMELQDRVAREEQMLAATFGLCVLYALCRKRPLSVWWQLLGCAGLLCAPIPWLAARLSPAGLLGTGPHLAPVVGVDVALCLASVLLLAGAFALRRKARRSSPETPTDHALSHPMQTNQSTHPAAEIQAAHD